MDVNMVICANCSEEWPDGFWGPCPDCGVTGFTRVGGSVNQSISLDNRGVCVEYGPSDGPWQEQWSTVRQLLAEIEKYYQPGGFPQDWTMKRNVKYFFIECFHLGDRLWEDKATGFDEDEIKKFILADPALKICEAVANTSKHRTRRNSKAMVAWVHSVTHNQVVEAGDAVIKWEQEQNTAEVDALWLAKECYSSWRQFQKDKKLKTLI